MGGILIQLAELRNARDAEAAARARVEAENRSLASSLGNAQREAAVLKEANNRLKAANDELGKQAREAQGDLENAQEEIQTLTSENNLLKDQLADATSELEQLRAECASASASAVAAESQLRSLQNDSDIARSKAASEMKRLQKAYDDLNEKHSHMQTELRDELSEQLATVCKAVGCTRIVHILTVLCWFGFHRFFLNVSGSTKRTRTTLLRS